MKPYNTKETKTEEIRQMFDGIAPKYDLLNHTLSFNIDKLWRRRVVRIVAKSNPKTVLDMATGTADLAIAISKRLPNAHITGIDLSEGMLKEGQKKVDEQSLSTRITLQQGDAERLDTADDLFDVATVSFGVRNFSDLGKGLSQICRTLKPGGQLVILEFSTPSNPLFGAIYRLYSERILPFIGGLISRDRRAYEYLPASVKEFAQGDEFIKIMQQAGFSSCTARSLSFGIAHIYIGKK